MKMKNTYSKSKSCKTRSVFSKSGICLFLFALFLSFRSFAAVPDPITGPNRVCAGATITLNDATPGGTWSSLSPTLAVVGSVSGIVTGLLGGTTTIVYRTSGGAATYVITIDPLLPIIPGGTPNICQDQSILLANQTLPVGGAWSSSNPGVVALSQVNNATTRATGVTPGTAIISFTTTMGCITTRTVTVSPTAPITGPSSVCAEQSIQLANAVPGGTWSTSAPTKATVDATGKVTGGNASGVLLSTNVTISYTWSSGCVVSSSVTVHPLYKIMPGTATAKICQNQSILMENQTLPAGGTWSISDASIATFSPISAGTMTATGLSAGNAIVSFTTTTGCITTRTITVAPTAPITGPASVCAAQSIQLANAVPGGTWSTAAPTKATIDATGKVTGGNSSGILLTSDVLIKYTTPTGCVVTTSITVNPLFEITPFSSRLRLCQNQPVLMANQTLPTGGVWSTSDAAIASFSPLNATTMNVTGVSPGNAVISFTTTTGCVTTRTVTVFATAPITGPSDVCASQSIQLSNAVSGGTWTTSAPTKAHVDATGQVTGGMYTGIRALTIVTIKYTLPTGCATTHTVAVSPMFPINPVTARALICENQSITMNNGTPPLGGVWSTSDPAIATISQINTTMISATGLSVGDAVISFTSGAGCIATRSVTVVRAQPTTGPVEVCAGQSIQLNNAVVGGTWSSESPTVANVDTTGKVTGGMFTSIISPTMVNIKYALSTGCAVNYSVLVQPLLPISPFETNAKICLNGVIIMNNSTMPLGGTWSTSNPSVASFTVISNSMMSASGVSLGSAVISFTTTGGCITTRSVTVIDCDTIATAIDETVAASGEITLFPNPNNGTFTVRGTMSSTSSFGSNDDISIEVIDMAGRIIYAKSAKAQGNELNEQIKLSHSLPDGLYMLKVKQAEQQKILRFSVLQ